VLKNKLTLISLISGMIARARDWVLVVSWW